MATYRFECLFCDQAFTTDISLKEHKNNTHFLHQGQVKNLPKEISISQVPNLVPTPMVSMEETKDRSLTLSQEATLTQELVALIEEIHLPESQQLFWDQEIEKINRNLQNQGIEGRLVQFGSSANGFSTKNSDLDLSFNQCSANALHIPKTKIERYKKIKTSDAVEEELNSALFNVIIKALIDSGYSYTQVKSKLRARTPIICLKTEEIEMDIGVTNHIAVENTHLLYTYASFDPRVKQLGIAIKHWAKKRRLSYSVNGTLCSYAFILLVIRFLQEAMVVPNLQRDYPDEEERKRCEDFDCSFETDLTLYASMRGQNDASLGSLLFQFFQFYSFFDWEHESVSIRQYRQLKSAKRWTHSKIAIEDPFELERNLGDTCHKGNHRIILNEFKRSLLILAEGRTFDAVCLD